jgi:hypothetical protein
VREVRDDGFEWMAPQQGHSSRQHRRTGNPAHVHDRNSSGGRYNVITGELSYRSFILSATDTDGDTDGDGDDVAYVCISSLHLMLMASATCLQVRGNRFSSPSICLSACHSDTKRGQQ